MLQTGASQIGNMIGNGIDRNETTHLDLHCLQKHLSWCTGMNGLNIMTNSVHSDQPPRPRLTKSRRCLQNKSLVCRMIDIKGLNDFFVI